MLFVLVSTETGEVLEEATFDAHPGVLAPQKKVQWQEAPLTRLQEKRWLDVSKKRDTLELAGFPYLGHPIDSDPVSVQRIAIAVQAAQAAAAAIAQPFSIDWKCKDDHTLTLDSAGMMGMSVALATHANALHQHGRALKAEIFNTTTQAELDAVDIDAGWLA